MKLWTLSLARRRSVAIFFRIRNDLPDPGVALGASLGDHAEALDNALIGHLALERQQAVQLVWVQRAAASSASARAAGSASARLGAP